MRKKHKAFLLSDSILGFFITLQALLIIPICIMPAQQKLKQVQQKTFFKVAIYQKLQHSTLNKLTLNNKLFVVEQKGDCIESWYHDKGMRYDQKKQTFGILTK
ncbi:hypothetical protein [Bombilactobacillus thymidiniphilus]|uniref:Competence protein ComGE n=1 Tax=Bombilactobacillus thymidiniphilus TaxID=2923363 RepID=A0ABY4PES6_9LACO|nr:hypothetical protein [Bombilactobacillus thymidiniphilus]UQS83802.1 hypothetical protein MOO47_00950 [Bombilactobacillus thymidiniphilus]